MNIILIFTYGVSLKDWDDSNLIYREILLYKLLTQKYGVKFTFITFGNEEDEKYRSLIKDLDIIPVYKHIKKSKFKIIDLLKVMFFSKKVKLLTTNPALIKTNQLTGSVLGILLKYTLKAPLIVRTGYNLFDFAMYEKRRFLVKLLYFLLTQISLLISDTYLVSSYVDKKSLKKNFITKSNIQIFPNWVKGINKDTGIPRFSDKILSVGRLEEQKNFSELISRISGSNYQLTIVGKGSLLEILKSESRNLKVDLEIIEQMEFNELNTMYQKYKIFISSSSFEGNPKVVLEAMANGCMVIAKNNINNREIITNKENGILFSHSDNLSELIRFYLGNEKERLHIVNNAFKYIEKNNTLNSLCEKEYEEYLKLTPN